MQVPGEPEEQEIGDSVKKYCLWYTDFLCTPQAEISKRTMEDKLYSGRTSEDVRAQTFFKTS